jgi:hypothetical protein
MQSLITSALATYRLTRLITTDEITAPIRDRIWETHPPETSRLGYLITCDWCSSVYAASALQLSRMIAPRTTTAVEMVLALSAAAALLAAHSDS